MKGKKFELVSEFEATGDQPQAIEKLAAGLKAGLKHQVLLGVTGSGKTFTMAKVIEKTQSPTLVISHNKTLAAQLFQEFREFFPHNAVEYFVSYYDYYQPEAYIPRRDQYIAKEVDINELIDKLRLSATASLMTRKDVIVVASVSCIYNLGSPEEYRKAGIKAETSSAATGEEFLTKLVDLRYERNDYDFKRATFRVRGEIVDVWPSYDDEALRLEFGPHNLEKISRFEPLTGNKIEELEAAVIYPAKHFMTSREVYRKALPEIRSDLEKQVAKFNSQGKELEAHRIKQRTEYDLELIQELGYCPGIENYSRYFDGRNPGEPAYTLLDYFSQGQALRSARPGLTIIDESHITVPQIRGMYEGDRARKETLIDYGFRLPSALDNRPLKFGEFQKRVGQVVYTSATPSEWEIKQARMSAKNVAAPFYGARSKAAQGAAATGIVEQLIRPTGLLDPEIAIRKTEGQIEDLVREIEARVVRGERVLVTTLTKRMAEELSTYLEEQKIKVHYLHADVETLKRSEILEDLRKGTYDVVVGINLLREGLDLPEVSLVAILDADKEGFLRSETSLIQTMGRAARHRQGQVIMYADQTTGSMRRDIDEIDRRRQIQIYYNKKHGIKPQSIVKPIRERLVEEESVKVSRCQGVKDEDIESMPPGERRKMMDDLELQMTEAARNLDFEQAALLRDRLIQIKKSLC